MNDMIINNIFTIIYYKHILSLFCFFYIMIFIIFMLVTAVQLFNSAVIEKIFSSIRCSYVKCTFFFIISKYKTINNGNSSSVFSIFINKTDNETNDTNMIYSYVHAYLLHSQYVYAIYVC